ncbi:MAG: hypothetical protein NDJ89_04745 [Oligoflexia bacterium]|nr:hypothetical protein [Oligoflexia bacterium]
MRQAIIRAVPTLFIVLSSLSLGSCLGGSEEPAPSPTGGSTSTYYLCDASVGQSVCFITTDQSRALATCGSAGTQIAAGLSLTLCPSSGLIWSCTGTLDGQYHLYGFFSSGGAPYNSSTAQSACASLGLSTDGGGGGGDGTTSSYQRCDQRTAGSQCVSYTGGSWTSSVESACTSGGGTNVTACPSANLLGKCSVPNATNLELVYFYYSDGGTPYNSTTAASACATYPGSTWTP